jgi:hypothetical protein
MNFEMREQSKAKTMFICLPWRVQLGILAYLAYVDGSTWHLSDITVI